MLDLNVYPDKEMLENSSMIIVDIRRESEWKKTGIVPDSNCITFFDINGRYDEETFFKAMDELGGKEAEIGLICRTGARTNQVATLMHQHGYKKVKNLDGGVMKLMGEGYKLSAY